MDGSAIQTIAGLSAAHAAQVVLSDEDLGAVIIPANYQLQSLEHLKTIPDYFRCSFSTTVLSQFIGYIDQQGTYNTGVFIDQKAMSAKAIIDMGNHDSPQWGKHRAGVTLDRTPAYAALLRNNDERLDQQTFIDFVEDWENNVLFYYGDSINARALDVKHHIKTLRKLKTSATATSENELGNFNANRSAMESIEITAGAEQPPTGFIFRVIPHDGFNEVSFDCQLRAMTDGKTVSLKFRIVQLALHQEQIAEEFRDKIKYGIHVDEINIFIGNMDYQK